MPKQKNKKEWEKFGEQDPYFGVLSREKFKKESLNEKNRKEFFYSGERYIIHSFSVIQKQLNRKLKFENILDFGCGIGRLIIPFSKHAKEVTGVDISLPMLKKAEENCEKRKIKNIVLVRSDNHLPSSSKKFELINSFLTFQHIEPRLGLKNFQELINLLSDDGIFIAHFIYDRDSKPFKKILPKIRRKIPFSNALSNLRHGKKINSPVMEIYHYNLNKIFKIIKKNNLEFFFTEHTTHGDHLGIILYLQKTNPS